MEKTNKKGFLAWFTDNWKRKPLFSTGIALLVMVILPDPIREHIVALERRVSELEEQMHNHYGTTVFKEDIQDDADL